MIVRRAQRSEARKLSQIAIAAKASWGYSRAFMDACRDMLAIDESAIERDAVFVIISKREPVGFYRISGAPPSGALADFWLLPAHQQSGNGRRLFEHAVSAARAAGYERLTFDSDPNAAGFYVAMGARLTGYVDSPMSPERKLPVFEFVIPQLPG